MKHITQLEEAKLTSSSVITIGAFDGVHRGHQYLISQLLEHSQKKNLTPVVLTFYPHPEMVLRGFRPGFYLTLPDAKAQLLSHLGVELVVTHPFNDDIRQMRAAHFVGRLLSHLNLASLWVGADFALGYQREGNVEFLTKLGEERGYDVRVVDLMDAGGERVSSSRIRQALAEGEVNEVARLLGRPFRLPGTVIEGAKRGRTIGIPTANLAIKEEQAIPARGVYAARALVDSEYHEAVVNIGRRPTFDGTDALVVEAHLLNFTSDIYGKTLLLDFVAHLRDEQKFDGIEALITQINRDIETARHHFKTIATEHPVNRPQSE